MAQLVHASLEKVAGGYCLDGYGIFFSERATTRRAFHPKSRCDSVCCSNCLGMYDTIVPPCPMLYNDPALFSELQAIY